MLYHSTKALVVHRRERTEARRSLPRHYNGVLAPVSPAWVTSAWHQLLARYKLLWEQAA